MLITKSLIIASELNKQVIMAIKSVELIESYLVKTDTEFFETDGNGNWKKLHGDSWEPYFPSGDFEKSFQDFMKNQK